MKNIGLLQLILMMENNKNIAYSYFLVVSTPSASAKKRNAPNAPNPQQQQQQTVYGTLPHSVGRYQQNYDLSDIYNTNSTLPHPGRNSMIEHQRQNNNNNNNTVTSNNNKNQQSSNQQHFDNKVYERFEPYMMQANKTSHKRSPSSDSITRSIQLGKENFTKYFD